MFESLNNYKDSQEKPRLLSSGSMGVLYNSFSSEEAGWFVQRLLTAINMWGQLIHKCASPYSHTWSKHRKWENSQNIVLQNENDMRIIFYTK